MGRLKWTPKVSGHFVDYEFARKRLLTDSISYWLSGSRTAAAFGPTGVRICFLLLFLFLRPAPLTLNTVCGAKPLFNRAQPEGPPPEARACGARPEGATRTTFGRQQLPPGWPPRFRVEEGSSLGWLWVKLALLSAHPEALSGAAAWRRVQSNRPPRRCHSYDIRSPAAAARLAAEVPGGRG